MDRILLKVISLFVTPCLWLLGYVLGYHRRYQKIDGQWAWVSWNAANGRSVKPGSTRR